VASGLLEGRAHGIPVIEAILADMDRVREQAAPRGRPSVTLAYAQSLDGSIALDPGRPFRLSGPEALRMTHALRAAHDAILVGIGTVLADDPQLTVRLVDGRSPLPVVVDSHLRTPAEARLFGGDDGRPAWIATTNGTDQNRRRRLEARGARVLRVAAWANGWVDLPLLMAQLAEQGVRRVMVEGGAKIITSFLRSRLVDYAVITVSPRLVGGLPVTTGLGEGVPLPELQAWSSHRLGNDLVLSGPLRWSGG
jgi:GTP cyclohydrolase II